MSRIILELSGVTKSIDTGTHRVDILKGIDLSIAQGEFAAIMGASGSGKSTLLGLLAGLDAPTTGSIRIDGDEIATLAEDKMADLRGRKIGFVFQSYQLIPTLTAEENVLLPAELAGEGSREARERARMLLETVGLRDRLDHYPVQLSGGEQQRVAIARALAPSPKILIADEPTGNLDTTTGRQIADLLFAKQRENGLTMVLVTHDPALAARCDIEIPVRSGRIEEPAQGGTVAETLAAGA